jgi:cell division protein FtsX
MLQDRTAVQLELQDGVSDAEISNLIIGLQNLPYISRAAFVTKEQAYDRARASDPELISFLEEYGLRNPFHDSVTITLSSLGQYRSLMQLLESGTWQDIVDPSFLSEANAEREYISSMLKLTEGMRSLVLFILCIGAATLLATVITLSKTRAIARSEEVLVERLAGAQTATILLPFITEASVLMSIAAVISLALATAIAACAPLLLPALASAGVLHELWIAVRELLWSFIPMALVVELLAIPFLATIGTWLGLASRIHSPRIAMT